MKEIIKELAGWLLYIVLIIALTWTVVTFVGQRTEVSGSSMETTLSDKDQLIVDKMTYRFRDPKRYDIVVFHINTRTIPIILSGSSGCRERQYRFYPEWFILMGCVWMNIMGMK